MDRLTKKVHGRIVRKCYHYRKEEMCYGCIHYQECSKNIITRLADYEDTKLMPEEIKELQNTVKHISLERLQEIMEAEKAGRLVILPCKIEDPIYLIREEKEPRKLVKHHVDEYNIDHFTIGETMIPMITACSRDNEWEELIDGTKAGSEFFLSKKDACKEIEQAKGE